MNTEKKTKIVHAAISEEAFKKLNEIKEHDRRTISWIIGEAIEEYINKRKEV